MINRRREQIVDEMIDGLRRGNYFSVLGPRYSGKTTVLHRLIETVEKDAFIKCAYWEANENKSISKTKNLYDQFKKQIRSRLLEEYNTNQAQPVLTPKYKKTFIQITRKKINSCDKFHELLAGILMNNNLRLVLVLNRLQHLPKHVIRSLLTCLREIYNNREYKEYFKRLNIVIAGSSNLLEFTTGEKSPFNISHPISLPHLTEDEAEERLLTHTEHNVFCPKETRIYLLREFNNHPYFINRIVPQLLNEAHKAKRSEITPEDCSGYLDRFIKEKNLAGSDRYLREMTFRLRDNPDIFETILTLLRDGEAWEKKPHKGVSPYYLSGAMIFKDGKLAFTNSLIKNFLSQYLDSLTKGDIYISFSKWDKAIEQYREYKKQTIKAKNLLESERLEPAVNSVIALINKCFEENRIWNYFGETLYYIFQLKSVEIFEKVSDKKFQRIFDRNGGKKHTVVFDEENESLLQFAYESAHHVLSDENNEAAFPIKSWDGQKHWIALCSISDPLSAIPEYVCKIIERFLRIAISAIDRVRANYDVFDMLGEEVSIVDREFNILYMNKMRRKRFGKGFRLGKDMKCYKKLAGHVHPPDSEVSGGKICTNCPAQEAFEEAARTGKTARKKTDTACLEKIDNQDTYLLQTSLTLRDEYGNFTRALNVSHDITKIQKIRDLIDEIFQLQQEGDLAKLFANILSRLRSMGYRRIRFYEYYQEAPEKEYLILKHHIGMGSSNELDDFVHNISQLGFFQDTFQKRESVLKVVKEDDFEAKSRHWISRLCLENVKVLFVPIYDNGNPYGLLGIDNKDSNEELDEEDRQIINSLTRYLVSSIQNILYAKQQKILYEITSELHNYATQRRLLPKIAKAIVKNCEVRTCSIFLYNRYKNKLVRYITRVRKNGKITDLPLEESYDPGESITGNIYLKGQSEIVHNLHQYSGDLKTEYINETEKQLKEELKNCLYVPIVYENETMGIIRISNRLDENDRVSRIGFKKDEVTLLENIGQQLGLAISKIQTSHNILWQTNIISSTLRTIQSVERKFLEQFRVERYSEKLLNDLFDKVYYILLTGLTIKSPFGFNRAILFREENDSLVCKRGIGPIDQCEADNVYSKEIWLDLMEEDKTSPYDVIMDRISGNYDRYSDFYKSGDSGEKDLFLSSRFDSFIKSIPIKRNDDLFQIFQNAQKNRDLVENEDDFKKKSGKSRFLSKIKSRHWVILPLIIEDKTQGLIYVDNKINKRPIRNDDIDSLKQFLDRIIITLSKLEALKKQMKQSRIQYSQFKIVKVLTQEEKMFKNVRVIQTELKKVLPYISNICLLQKVNNSYKRISSCVQRKNKKSCEECERADRKCLVVRQDYYCPEKGKDPYFKRSPGTFRSRYLIKLMYDKDELGILDIDSELPDAFSVNDRQIIQNISHQLSVEMIKAKVNKEKESILKEREQMLRDKEQSFSEIAHDMKAPLVGVQNLSLNVVDFDLNKEDLNENLLLIANEAKRVLKFTNQILDLARLEYKKEEFKFTKTSINKIISAAIEENNIYAKTKSICINFPDSPTNIIAEADEDNFQKVVAQIIQNAIKYSHDNSKVNIKLSESKSNVNIEVRDYGIGIPKAEIKTIFNKHERGKYAKSFTTDGIGIGLTIVDLIIKAHGGKISIESEVGKGSRFTIKIPKKRRDANGKKATVD